MEFLTVAAVTLALAAVIPALLLAHCDGCPPSPPSSDAGGDVVAETALLETSIPDASEAATLPYASTRVMVSNTTDAGAIVNVSVGADSVVQPSAWSGCPDAGLTCSFPLNAGTSQALAAGGNYLSAAVAFNGPVGCGNTIAEFTANNANGYGTADVSLVKEQQGRGPRRRCDVGPRDEGGHEQGERCLRPRM